jgi:hypothetical protein
MSEIDVSVRTGGRTGEEKIAIFGDVDGFVNLSAMRLT